MSQYIYTFVKGGTEIEVEGYNIWSAARNAGLTIVRADRLSRHYLQSTPFDQRERPVWIAGEHGGSSLWILKQKRK